MPTIAEIIAAKSAKSSKTAAVSPKSGGAAATVAKKPGLMITPDAPEPKQSDPHPRRSLSTTSGEDVPPLAIPSDPAGLAWHSAMQSLDTELCIMVDPDARNERAWIAIRRPDMPNKPLFLFALPFYQNPHASTLSEPF